MAQFDIEDLVVTEGTEKLAPKLALKVGSKRITVAVFRTGEDADAVEEILTDAKKRLATSV